MTDLAQIYRQSKILTFANMKSRYRKTFAGFLWVVMNPLIMYAIQCYVFKRVLSSTNKDYSLFLLGGLLPWFFISQSLEMGTSVFVSSAHLLKANFVHPLVILSAQIFDNAINFFFAFVIVLLISAWFGSHVPYGVILLPLPLLLLFFGTFSLSLALATINVFFRDTRFVVSVALNVLFFTTPIFYAEAFGSGETTMAILY